MRVARAAFAVTVASVVAIAAAALARVDIAPSERDENPLDGRRVLAKRPVDGRAYRAIALREGRPDLLAIANARWPRDVATRAHLADRALAAGDASAGLDHLDALLRIDPSTRAVLLPALMPYLGDPRVQVALVDRLANDPPWRDALLDALGKEGATPGDAHALLLAMPQAPDVVQARIAVLARAGRDAEARTLWLGTLPAQARAGADLLYDGGFEAPFASASPYAWRFDDAPGAAIEVAGDASRTGTSALSIEFADRVIRFAAVRQSLALAPGRYRLQAATLDAVDTTRPFEWHLSCRDGDQVARLVLPRASQWRTTATTFDVPAGCNAQVLVLVHAARSLAERRLRGRLLVDDVGIFLMPTQRHE